MRPLQYPCSDRGVQQLTTSFLLQQLHLPQLSGACTPALIVSLLVAAACRRTFLFTLARLFRLPCSDETVRTTLRESLPEYDRLRRQGSRMLSLWLPASFRRARRLKRARRRKHKVAIDYHKVPFWNRGGEPPPRCLRSASQHGTCYFHVYASLMLLKKGQRYTVALRPVLPGDKTPRVLRALLDEARRRGVRVGLLLVDRGFWSAEVLRYLQQARIPYVLPVVARGRLPEQPGGPGGTRVFFHKKKTGRYAYTVCGRGKRRVRVTIWVLRRNHRGRKGKRGRYAWVYAGHGVRVETALWLRKVYRGRFAIETSYRQGEQARLRTTSRDERQRLLAVLLGLLLRNVWLYVNAERQRQIAQGFQPLPLAVLLEWIHQATTEEWPLLHEPSGDIDILAPPGQL